MDGTTLHVLALSGGGYRGLYTATVLAELEKKIGYPLANKFDLICGTSVGGMLALGLASEIPATKLQSLFIKHGEEIFRKKTLLPMFGSYCNPNALYQCLDNLLGDETMAELRHRVLITSVNCTTGKGQFFKTPHHKSFVFDKDLKIADVAKATSAAPLVFPLFQSDKGTFADGGLVGNAPGLFGYHEAIHFLTDNSKKATVRLLAIGTMSTSTTIVSKQKDFGLWFWILNLFSPANRLKLLNLLFSAQEHSTDFILNHLLGNDYYKIDDTPTAEQAKYLSLFDVTQESTTILRNTALSTVQNVISDKRFSVFLNHNAHPLSNWEKN